MRGAAPTTVNFGAIAVAALPHVETLCARWLPAGRREGHEWRCGDLAGAPGKSLSINLTTGRWADFATGDKGGDVISLAAAIHNMSQAEAARAVAAMLGLTPGGRHV